MKKVEVEENPVMLELQSIKDQIARETANFTDEELVGWYEAEAQKALALASSRAPAAPLKTTNRQDPVIQEIRAIREEIAQITKGFSDEELLAWYKSEAQKALSLATSQQKTDIDSNPSDSK